MFCKNCGQVVPDNAAVCANCGAPIANEQNPYTSQNPQGYGYQQPNGYYQQPYGYPQQPYGYPQQPYGYPQQPYGYRQPNPMDAPSVGYAILCFFFPVLGLILYLVWKDEYPQRAKSCGKGALISVIVGVVMALIAVIIVITVVPSVIAWGASLR